MVYYKNTGPTYQRKKTPQEQMAEEAAKAGKAYLPNDEDGTPDNLYTAEDIAAAKEAAIEKAKANSRNTIEPIQGMQMNLENPDAPAPPGLPAYEAGKYQSDRYRSGPAYQQGQAFQSARYNSGKDYSSGPQYQAASYNSNPNYRSESYRAGRGYQAQADTGPTGSFMDEAVERAMRELLESRRETTSEEQLAERNTAKAEGKALADSRARAGFAGFGMSGAASAAEGDIRRQAADQLSSQILGIQQNARDERFRNVGLASSEFGKATDRRLADETNRADRAMRDRQFGYDAGQKERMFGAELGQKDRQFGAQLNQDNRQFGAKLTEDSRQFGADLGQRDRQFGAQLNQDNRQFGAKLNEDSRQFGAQLGQQDRQFGYETGQKERFFGAEFGQRDKQFGAELNQKDKQFEAGLARDDARIGIESEQNDIQREAWQIALARMEAEFGDLNNDGQIGSTAPVALNGSSPAQSAARLDPVSLLDEEAQARFDRNKDGQLSAEEQALMRSYAQSMAANLSSQSQADKVLKYKEGSWSDGSKRETRQQAYYNPDTGDWWWLATDANGKSYRYRADQQGNPV